ncbi:YqjF family protein [Bacillus marasmi]|uniref:YqjF family protein n=1 Tax=Bacillus marasmi TaxID=1926279 RepID=UPI0011C9CDA4|nr:DUF2071 domain-containing protein [Bacillus marasmi]
MNLLNDISHRLWPIPSGIWIMKQKWSNLLFAHWPIPEESLRSYIPSSLKIDTFNGAAWLGVVAFVMDGIYLRGLKGFSVTPRFTEVNVRTYVHYNGKPGVYFLSLDVGDKASLMVAKRWYRLPYQPAKSSLKMEDKAVYWENIRRGKSKIPIEFKGKFVPLSRVYYPEQGTFEHWATERYCLYSKDNRDNLYTAEIHHSQWPLQNVEAEIFSNTLFTPFQLQPTESKPIVHFSKGLETIFWNIKRLKI